MVLTINLHAILKEQNYFPIDFGDKKDLLEKMKDSVWDDVNLILIPGHDVPEVEYSNIIEKSEKKFDPYNHYILYKFGNL